MSTQQRAGHSQSITEAGVVNAEAQGMQGAIDPQAPTAPHAIGGISIGDGGLMSLAELAKKLPGRKPGKHIASSTLWRWCTKGVKGHRMPSIALGGTRATTLAAAQQFIDRLTELSAGAAPTLTASQRHKAASEYCSRQGI